MSFRVTQCPACESTFSISPRLLESAAGKVRCGACLTVFEAAENFLATGFDSEEENESVFVGNSAQEFFDPSSFLTRQSLQESLPESPSADLLAPPNDIPAPEPEPEPEPTASIPEPRLDPEDPDTPDYLVLDSAELAVDAGGTMDQAEQPAYEENEFLALVADAQASPPDLTPAPPVAEALAAGGYPALEEDIDALLADQQEPQVPADTAPFANPFLAAGGYPALEDVIADLLAPAAQPATPEALARITIPDVPFSASSALSSPSAPSADEATPSHAEKITETSADSGEVGDEDEPGSLPLFPEETAADGISNSAAPLAPAETQAPAPEAFQLHVKFSVAPGTYGLPTESQSAHEPVPGSSATLADNLEQEFNKVLNEADFQAALSRDMDSAPSEQPDVELPAETEPETAATAEQAAEPDQSVAAIRARALQSDLQDDEALEAIPEENLASLGMFSTPVEILTGRQRRLGKQLAWASLALVAAFLLAGQYLWQETQRYAQMASVRPVYEWACNMIGCQLPTYSDINAIESSNLAVRSHPELDNALSVSVEFRNGARFAQPFPIMVLSFNSASNSVIALREFAPEDYLPPALRTRQLMPPQSPVQVNLELIDPGDDAVNYTLAFRRP